VRVTLLFTQAQLNGTLDKLAHSAVRVCPATRLDPITFFLLGCGIASLGRVMSPRRRCLRQWR
jgi:hypothetical protein